MPRERWVWDREAKDLVLAAEYYSRPRPDTRSSLPRPYIAGDTMEVQSMADGKVYTSKAQYRKSLRALGMTEVGNDSSLNPENIRPPDPLADMTPVETDIKRAIAEVSSR
jgi:hypothetical protein